MIFALVIYFVEIWTQREVQTQTYTNLWKKCANSYINFGLKISDIHFDRVLRVWNKTEVERNKKNYNIFIYTWMQCDKSHFQALYICHRNTVMITPPVKKTG